MNLVFKVSYPDVYLLHTVTIDSFDGNPKVTFEPVYPARVRSRLRLAVKQLCNS